MALIMPGQEPPDPPPLPQPYPYTAPPTGLPPIADNVPRGVGTPGKSTNLQPPPA